VVEKIKAKHEPEWHLLEGFFTREDGMEPASIDGVPVLIPGKLGEVPVIQIPASATPDVFDRISKAVIEAAGVEPFIITSNVQILRFKRISEKKAKAMMAKTKEQLSRIGAERDRLQGEDEAAADADAEEGDGDGSEPDGLGVGDAGADGAEGAGDGGGDDAAQPGLVEEQEA
jgi:hypothetical protein